MIKDIQVNKPEPILSQKPIEIFNRSSNTKDTIRLLEDGKQILIIDFYSNGLSLLNELHKHLKRTIPSCTFQEQRKFKAQYHKLSNLILIEIEAHKIALKKAPSIGWLQQLYPEIADFMLPLPKVQGLNSAWQWYQNGILTPVLRNKIHPYYGTYFPTRSTI